MGLSIMRFAIIGTSSQKVYAEGTETEVHRKLNAEFPSYKKQKPKKVWMVGKDIVVDPILPELMKIIKVDDIL